VKILVLILLTACASKYTPVIVDQKPGLGDPPQPVEVRPVQLKTPKINLPSKPSQAMIKATEYFAQYANSDEFYDYFKANARPLRGGNRTDLAVTIMEYRKCLDTRPEINIVWGRYAPWSRAIGGYADGVVYQNPKTVMTAKERAAHFLHELSHWCGMTHEVNGKLENNPSRFPILLDSFPYQGGEHFEKFLGAK
jgi:hypothetical protein